MTEPGESNTLASALLSSRYLNEKGGARPSFESREVKLRSWYGSLPSLAG
jgi:hypothetical protein